MEISHSHSGEEYFETDDGVLVEKGESPSKIYIPDTGDFSATMDIYPGRSVERFVMDSGGNWNGEGVEVKEVRRLLELGKISEEDPLEREFGGLKVYGPGLSAAERGPVEYDPADNSMVESGVNIPELDEFVESNREKDAFSLVSGFLTHLYDHLEVNHATDAEEGVEAGEIEDNEDDNVLKALRRGYGLCGELERMLTYTMRNAGIPAGRPPNCSLRYRLEDGVSVPDPEGPLLVGHGFSQVDLGDGEVSVDPSIYVHLREKGMGHEEAAAKSVDREDVYYSQANIDLPPYFEGEIKETSFSPLG